MRCVVDFLSLLTCCPAACNALCMCACRYSVKQIVWHSVWHGAAYNTQDKAASGSAYVDVAIFRTDRAFNGYIGTSRPGQCGQRTISMRACGYPIGGDAPVGASDGSFLYCSDGISYPVDYCDGMTDLVRSPNCAAKVGQTGAPLLDRDTGAAVGLFSSWNGNGWNPEYM